VLVISSFVERPIESLIGIGLILTGVPFYFSGKERIMNQKKPL